MADAPFLMAEESEMTREEIAQAYNSTPRRGEGLNGYSGNYLAAQQYIPNGVGGDAPVDDGGINPITRGELRDIVNDMSNDYAFLRQEYKEENPNASKYADWQVGAIPQTRPMKFYSDYNYAELPDDFDEDYLYNNPEQKGIEDYFADRARLDWFYNNPLMDSPAQRDEWAQAFNLARGMNDWQRKENLNQFKDDMLKENLYGETINDLLSQSEEGLNLLNEAKRQTNRQISDENRPKPRERNITGTGHF